MSSALAWRRAVPADRPLALVLTLGAAGAAALVPWLPLLAQFAPACPFHAWTGLPCPGCGTTRALHHLLHGRFEEAFRLNPMIFVLIAVALFALPSVLRGRYPGFLMKPWFAWAAFAVLTSYWIVRNTPLYPF